MKEIPLTQGMVALVDDEDYEALVQWKWHCMFCRRTNYAVRRKSLPDGKQGAILMHRVILNTPSGFDTDHINGNGLDNRKENLRVATRSQNNLNTSRYANNTSGYKGVGWRKEKGKWEAYIKFNNKKIFLGYFKDKTEAAIAYNEAVVKTYGSFAHLNQIDG